MRITANDKGIDHVVNDLANPLFVAPKAGGLADPYLPRWTPADERSTHIDSARPSRLRDTHGTSFIASPCRSTLFGIDPDELAEKAAHINSFPSRLPLSHLTDLPPDEWMGNRGYRTLPPPFPHRRIFATTGQLHDLMQ